jgi:hypothetical protein
VCDLENFKNEEAMTHVGSQRHRKRRERERKRKPKRSKNEIVAFKEEKINSRSFSVLFR